MLINEHRSLYAAFDRFPSRKGAAVHIARFAPTLFEHVGNGILYVLGGGDMPVHQVEGDVEIVRYPGDEENFLERAMGFGHALSGVLDESRSTLEIVHFRDPWSGAPILSRSASCRTVYEVNGLPSIELPYLFPSIAPRTKKRIEAMERYCLERADHLVTPSMTTRDLLVSLGVASARITVIPNGADPIEGNEPRPAGAPERYLIYIGALQPWQGPETLLRAFARLADIDLSLVICASNRSRHAKRVERLAEKLELSDRIIWNYALSGSELIPWLTNAFASIAPLRDCDRNAIQGCSPLKIIESMAAGVPVVASDLPPVREIVEDEVDGILVPPDRPAAFARAIRVLLDYPADRKRLGAAAREKVSKSFTWSGAVTGLTEVYEKLVLAAPATPTTDRTEILTEGP